MRLIRLSMVVASLAALAACSSDSSTDGGTNNPSNCSISLTVALSANSTCSTISEVYATSTNQSGLAITYSGSPAMTVAIAQTGTPSTGTITATTPGVVGGITVVNGSNVWTQVSGSSPVGTFTLSYSTVTAGVTGASGTVYTVHGTLDATLPPQTATGATGSLTVHISF